jgi:hypothetical protein
MASATTATASSPSCSSARHTISVPSCHAVHCPWLTASCTQISAPTIAVTVSAALVRHTGWTAATARTHG